MQLFAVSIALIFANYAGADLIAFTGDLCDGTAGGDAPCDGSCIPLPGRHSFEIITSGAKCVIFFEDSSCQTRVGTKINEGSGECDNINTGTAVGSATCGTNVRLCPVVELAIGTNTSVTI